MNCDVCGYYMLHCRCPEDAPPEAQAEIARLQAEVSELKLQIGMCDHSLHAAWNDAIEAAANLSKRSSTEGGVAKSMAFFAKAEDHWVYRQACMDYAGAILALKK